LGPSLGGWLTDSYDWRWVFFINIPVGALATWGIWRYIHPVAAARRMRFDMFGFAALSIAIGSLQLFLDRGEQNDWFSSSETWVEIIVMFVAFVYFIAHTVTTPAEKSFLDYRLLKNSNYVSGLVFIFIVGVVMFSVRALLPTMLESLLNYPVTTTGLVTAPSGIGTMASMFIAGRMIGKIDLRLLLLSGFLVTAISLWQMTGYTLDITEGDILWPGVIQGFGLGLVFVPLSAATFATLNPQIRAQGTAIFSLMRNIGSSIGISMVQALLVRGTSISHAALVEHVTHGNPAWNNPAIASAYNLQRLSGAAALDGVVTQQAAFIAYLNDFRLMLYMTLGVIPLLLLMRAPGKRSALPPAEAAAALD
jgi:DHA2 family multidrug resistance protein